MENFRLFLIRLLQVLWVLTIVFSTFAFVVESYDFRMLSDTLLVVGIPLVLIQFLIFARINPYELFDGRIKQNLESQGNPND